MNSLSTSYDESLDQELRAKALQGSRSALGALLERHQHFIYNIVWKMVLNPDDAEDITQDIVVKIITNLARFRGESALRTWIYRIAINHVLSLKRQRAEFGISTFAKFGQSLDTIADSDYPRDHAPSPEDQMVVEEAKLGCTTAMLICLDREERIVYVLGEIFEVDHALGAEVLEISKDNFRQRLARARKNLNSFIQNKCGLVNKNNPCRCRKKTQGFIERGWVDPHKLKFNTHYVRRIHDTVESRMDGIASILEQEYAAIYRKHPYQERAGLALKIKEIIAGPQFKDVFHLN